MGAVWPNAEPEEKNNKNNYHIYINILVVITDKKNIFVEVAFIWSFVIYQILF